MATTTSKACLKLQHIAIDFHGQRVLKDVNLLIEEQEIVSIIGPNGAGKTTLFDIICGLKRPSHGSVHFHDRNITRWKPHRICHSGISRTFQIARPFPEMTALQNVLIGLWFGKHSEAPRSGEREQALELLQLVGIGHKADTPARALTLSEQRRLEVARALGTRPHLLLLDEIAAGLSPQAIKQAVELVKALRGRGLTLLIIDHFLNLTARVSDRLVAMDQGEIIVEGKPFEVLQNSEVVSAYLGEREYKDGKDDSDEN